MDTSKLCRVTFLGEYSSGKTALLNALLTESLFTESITKETAIDDVFIPNIPQF